MVGRKAGSSVNLDDIASLPIDWRRTPPVHFVRHDELEAEGHAVAGRVVHWDPTAGALSYDRQRDVGVLILANDRGWQIVSLEKGALGTTVRHAIAQGASMGLQPGNERFWMVIRYLGTDGRVKRYRATAGQWNDAASWPT